MFFVKLVESGSCECSDSTVNRNHYHSSKFLPFPPENFKTDVVDPKLSFLRLRSYNDVTTGSRGPRQRSGRRWDGGYIGRFLV